MILDGGSCSGGIESTVIDGLCNPPKLLRPGGLTYENIASQDGDKSYNCQVETHSKKNEQVRTPGMKYKHYSQSASVILFVPTSTNNDNTNKVTILEKNN